MRRALRAFSTVLMVAGALVVADAGLTVVWQEPVSAGYAYLMQERLDDDLRELERVEPSTVQRRALGRLETAARRMAFLARALKRSSERGDAVGRLRVPSIDADHVVVNGTDSGSLRKGPGVYDQTPLPGAPGTVGIAGHRTTYGAPFRDLDEIDPGDRIHVDMPYGRFTYVVERTRIVPPSQISVLDDVSFDRLVLSACHPLYSAAKRIVVFARLATATPRGSAVGQDDAARAASEDPSGDRLSAPGRGAGSAPT